MVGVCSCLAGALVFDALIVHAFCAYIVRMHAHTAYKGTRHVHEATDGIGVQALSAERCALVWAQETHIAEVYRTCDIFLEAHDLCVHLGCGVGAGGSQRGQDLSFSC